MYSHFFLAPAWVENVSHFIHSLLYFTNNTSWKVHLQFHVRYTINFIWFIETVFSRSLDQPVTMTQGKVVAFFFSLILCKTLQPHDYQSVSKGYVAETLPAHRVPLWLLAPPPQQSGNTELLASREWGECCVLYIRVTVGKQTREMIKWTWWCAAFSISSDQQLLHSL